MSTKPFAQRDQEDLIENYARFFPEYCDPTVSKPQCENLSIFLSLRFCVKSIFAIFESQTTTLNLKELAVK